MFNPKRIAELVADCPEFTNVTWLSRLPLGDVTQHAHTGDAVFLHETWEGELTGTTLLVLVLRKVEAADSGGPPNSAPLQ